MSGRIARGRPEEDEAERDGRRDGGGGDDLAAGEGGRPKCEGGVDRDFDYGTRGTGYAGTSRVSDDGSRARRDGAGNACR